MRIKRKGGRQGRSRKKREERTMILFYSFSLKSSRLNPIHNTKSSLAALKSALRASRIPMGKENEILDRFMVDDDPDLPAEISTTPARPPQL
jgi:hypothetical protein